MDSSDQQSSRCELELWTLVDSSWSLMSGERERGCVPRDYCVYKQRGGKDSRKHVTVVNDGNSSHQ